MWKTRGKLIIYTSNIGKIYKGIWRFVSKISHISNSGNLSTKTEGRSSTSLMYGGDKGNAGRKYANKVKRG